MQPIIRRTITITITETWTITWPDGQETAWAETHEVASPAVRESDTPRLPTLGDHTSEEVTCKSDGADLMAEDE